MAQPSTEPSMEDILASIKRIIAEDGEAAPPVRAQSRMRRGPVAVPDPEPAAAGDADDTVDDAPAPPAPATPQGADHIATSDPAALAAASAAPDASPAQQEPADVLELTSPLPEERDPILSGAAEQASRSAFAALGQLQLRAESGQPATLEGLVADLLKPMLREWLDRELPGIVERLVAAEVKRVSGRG